MSKKCDEKCADTKDKSNNGSFLVFSKKPREANDVAAEFSHNCIS